MSVQGRIGLRGSDTPEIVVTSRWADVIWNAQPNLYMPKEIASTSRKWIMR